ncbi:TonB-dependent receptor domain-containing protein [Sphingobium nicotianae]|uniref:TonB-dependent receptor n=1 Tax=Sphingobium nicotianae TaxID=2782607 RepID=A0A9X1DCZ2_9SPHN|nr:TonB-dependent receptor [Sphingobium nicotianae]MBT2187614.1 TonB-dependent receptor [Sphingobium nicotianae]
MRAFKTSTAVSVLALLAVPNIAWAQGAEQPQQSAENTDLGEIVVTGSRIGHSTFNSPTPVTVISGDTIQALGQVNIGETIQSLPQNVSKSSDTNTGLTATIQNINAGANIADLRGLNPNNGVRTLTMIDTRRVVPSTTGGAVDTNIIPSMLVKSVETVTGGASAAYGTDALAGVVNVILDKELNGIKGQVDYGQTFRGDGKTTHVSFAAGTGFDGDHGHIIFGAEYQNSGVVGDCVYVREWCAKSPDTFDNQFFATNKLPRTIRGDNGAYTNYALSTVIRMTTLGPRFNPLPLRGLVFNDAGTQVLQYDAGQYTSNSGFGERQGGTCTLDCSPWSEVQLRPEVKRLSLFSHADYEFSPKLKAFIEGSYASRASHVAGISLGPSSGTPIRSDYFYLKGVTYYDQASGTNKLLSDLIAANPSSQPTMNGISQAPGVPTTALFIAKHMRNVPGTRQSVNTDMGTWRIATGLKGDLDIFNGLKWDAYYQYGRTTQDVVVTGNRVNRFFMYALDAVDQGLATTGVANGVAVCRATLPGPANTSTPAGFEQHWNQADAAGCVPLNILGKNTENPAAIAYAYRDATERFTYNQHVAALNVSGDVFDGWAGPISIALGGEYRFESGATTHNKLPFNVTNTNSPFGNDIKGDLKILETYGEVNLPLLKDFPIAQYVELNGAVRETFQTNKDGTSGNSKNLKFTTWKASAIWDVTDWLRFRATRSRDVRAASFTDLYTNLPTVDPGPPAGGVPNWYIPPSSYPSTVVNDFAKVTYPANFALKPEVGNTLTVGVVFQPKGFATGLRLSVDYYRIDLQGAIGVLTANDVFAACYNANSFCDKILAADGTPFSQLAVNDPKRQDVGTVIRGANNIGSVLTEGWDVELLYSLQLDKIAASLPGRLTLRGLATINDKMIVDPNTTDSIKGVDYHNQTGGSAFSGFTAPSKYILTSYATYDIGGFSMTWDAKYIPRGIYDVRKSTSLPYTDGFSINNNDVGARLYIGLSTSYRFNLAGGKQNAEFFLSIRNLFDRDPPSTPSNVNGSSGYVAGNGGPTNPVFYDTLGARWRAGVRVAF